MVLGSVLELRNSAQATTVQYSYDPYGGTTASVASTNTVKYTGRDQDLTDLYYYRNRYYKPSVGRFISEDPIGLSGGTNLYGYVGGDPLNLIDPLGLLNKVKVTVGVLNGANAIRLGLQAKGLAFASVFAFGIGQPHIGISAAALAAYRSNSAKSAIKRGGKQIGEGLAESSCNASMRNLLGLLPFGDRFDDADEPLPLDIDLIQGLGCRNTAILVIF